HLAIDHAFAGLELDFGDLRERNQRPVARRQQQVPDRLGTVAGLRSKADADVVMAFANEHLADGAAADPRADQVGDIGNVDTESRRRRAIDPDRYLRQLAVLIGRGVAHARRVVQYTDDVLADALEFAEIIP